MPVYIRDHIGHRAQNQRRRIHAARNIKKAELHTNQNHAGYQTHYDVYSLTRVLNLGIWIFAQVVYFAKDMPTYCTGGCDHTFKVALLSFIILHYFLIGIGIIVLIVICCLLVQFAK
jgi:hypothetical protein